MASFQSRNYVLSANLALALALIGAAAMVYYHQRLFMPRVAAVRHAAGLDGGYSFGNDFYQVWFSCRELFRARRDPYTPEMTREIQIGLYGRPLDPQRASDPVDQRAYPYPLYTDLIFWPFQEISFPAARVIVFPGLLFVTLAGVFLWMEAMDFRASWQWKTVILLLSLSSYSALEALFAGQIGLLVIFLLTASIVALQRERPMLGGFFLALATIKPQVVALPILYLIFWAFHGWKRRYRFVVGFVSMMAILLLGALLVLPNWIHSWIQTLLAYRRYTTPPLVREVLTSPFGPRFAGPASTALTIGSIVLAIAIAWRYCSADLKSFDFWLAISLLFSITTITILPGQAVYDHLVLIPAILLLAAARTRLLSAGTPSRILWWLGVAVLLWPWASAFALIIRRLVSADGISVLSLPIRTAASLPFVVFALLACTWRLSAKSPEAV
jgi:Glycosyltransferase family 87